MGMKNRGVNGLEVPHFKIDILRACDTFATAKDTKDQRSFHALTQLQRNAPMTDLPADLRFGYPCQNETLSATTNRGIKLASIGDIERIQKKIGENLYDLKHMLLWNREMGIQLFRIGQHLIPFASHPSFPYEWAAFHRESMEQIGEIARETEQRLSMHPGQFINPGSPNDEVVERSLAELTYSATVLDLMNANNGVIVLHLGGAYGDKPSAMRRFIEVMRHESQINRYLALEVDERVWTATEVTEVASELGVGAIIDNLHHRLNPGDLSLEDAIRLARPTWETRPKLHLSGGFGPGFFQRPRSTVHGQGLRSVHAIDVAGGRGGGADGAGVV